MSLTREEIIRNSERHALLIREHQERTKRIQSKRLEECKLVKSGGSVSKSGQAFARKLRPAVGLEIRGGRIDVEAEIDAMNSQDLEELGSESRPESRRKIAIFDPKSVEDPGLPESLARELSLQNESELFDSRVLTPLLSQPPLLTPTILEAPPLKADLYPSLRSMPLVSSPKFEGETPKTHPKTSSLSEKPQSKRFDGFAFSNCEPPSNIHLSVESEALSLMEHIGLEPQKHSYVSREHKRKYLKHAEENKPKPPENQAGFASDGTHTVVFNPALLKGLVDN